MQELQSGQKPASPGRNGKNPSTTAELGAIMRWAESGKPEAERVCYDPYAVHFINRAYFDFAGQYPDLFGIVRMYLDRISPCILARVRYFDDVLKSSIDDGLEQLVILGAGYDMRAFRIDGMDQIRAFEVDQPATQSVKVEKVKAIFGSLPGNVTFVPLDLDSENLGQRLVESGYGSSKKTLFLLEGLSYYIAPSTIDDILSFIVHNSGRGSAVAFDYYPKSVIDGSHAQYRHGGAMVSREPAEQWKFGVEGPVEAFLEARGFTGVVNVAREQCKREHFQGKGEGKDDSKLMQFVSAKVA